MQTLLVFSEMPYAGYNSKMERGEQKKRKVRT